MHIWNIPRICALILIFIYASVVLWQRESGKLKGYKFIFTLIALACFIIALIANMNGVKF
jgi:hypothetical protein